mmetsp:Transcript_28291/g.28581  ORF Transcript_28291/g.28581 Transcript_28291/m.28581 type:complete len:169 (-) Transcript_28291:49-555(-)
MNNNVLTATVPVSPSKNRYPYCIVWSPLPPITWLLPFVGHMGIGNSEGILFDFAGPYTIGVGNLAFGAPTRYVELDPSKCSCASWDEGCEEGCEVYAKRMHNLFCDNCHSHVAKCLNHMNYDGYSRYDMIMLAFWVFFFGKFTGVVAIMKTFLPFTVLVCLIYFFTQM